MANLIVRWRNNEHYREGMFMNSNTLVPEYYSYVVTPQEMSTLTEVNRKLLYKYIKDSETDNGDFIFSIVEPVVEGDKIGYRLRILNKIKISINELIRELKYQEQIMESRKLELSRVQQVAKVAARAEVPAAKKKKWKFW